MTMEENKAIVRRLLEEGLSDARSDPAVLHKYFADHFVDHVRIHHEKQGVHGVKDAMTEVHDASEGFRMKVVRLVAEGDWVAVHWEAAATRRRALEQHRQLKGIEPTAGEKTAAGITLFHLEGGKIVESWNYDNALELYAQDGKQARVN
jgi:predicted SnoaL-like aldol condensation-catalyzing enzyme